MPLITRNNVRFFHRVLFSEQNEKITIYKRGDDQSQGTVTPYILFGCRHSRIYHAGETLQGTMSAQDRCVWHIPVAELQRVGLAYLAACDIIEDKSNRRWEVEGNDTIEIKLFEMHLDLSTRRIK